VPSGIKSGSSSLLVTFLRTSGPRTTKGNATTCAAPFKSVTPAAQNPSIANVDKTEGTPLGAGTRGPYIQESTWLAREESPAPAKMRRPRRAPRRLFRSRLGDSLQPLRELFGVAVFLSRGRHRPTSIAAEQARADGRVTADVRDPSRARAGRRTLRRGGSNTRFKRGAPRG